MVTHVGNAMAIYGKSMDISWDIMEQKPVEYSYELFIEILAELSKFSLEIAEHFALRDGSSNHHPSSDFDP